MGIQIRNLGIGVLLGIILAACQKDLYNFSSPFSPPKIGNSPAIIQYIQDPSNAVDYKESKQLEKVADYTKLPFGILNKAVFNSNGSIGSNSRVVCLSDFSDLTDNAIDSLTAFVGRGGTLLVTKAQTDPRAMFITGMRPESDFSRDSVAFGIRFKSALFPGRKGFRVSLDKVAHNGLNYSNFEQTNQVLATAESKVEYPLVVQRQLGRGKVILWNSQAVFEKSYRGLLFSLVLQGLEGVPYSVANVSTIFLDDFPSPLYDIMQEPIKSEMGLSNEEYVQKVWWPDMKAFAQKENITYSTYVAFDYNTHITPPFTFNEWDNNLTTDNGGKLISKSTQMGQDVINSGHEMALHGYNHVSLLQSDWKRAEYMKTGLEAASKKWKLSGFGNMPISYVPPSNYIDSIGLVQLHKAMPSIKYIQSTYFGEKEVGGNREFDPDPYVNWFFGYPRISSGFFLEPDDWWAVESMYLYTGIWTHFVHPDDVFQIPEGAIAGTQGHFEFRNKYGLKWESHNGEKGLFDSFKADMAEFKSLHPMSRFLAATEASEKVSDWRYSDYVHLEGPKEYGVTGDSPAPTGSSSFWFCYLPRSQQKIVEKDLTDKGLAFDKREFADGHLYTIKSRGPSIYIPNIKGLANGEDNRKLISELQSSRTDFYAEREALKPILSQLTDLIDQGDVPAAIWIFEEAVNKGTWFTQQHWADYATWLSWDDRTDRLWETMEKHYSEFPSSELTKVAMYLGDNYGFLDNATQELWLVRAMDWDTEDSELLKRYLADFNTEGNKNRIAQVLKKLVDLTSEDAYGLAYVEHILHYRVPGYLETIRTLEPCNQRYATLSNDLAWVLAESDHIYDALKWARCATIDQVTIDEWHLRIGDFEGIEARNFPFYLEYLMSTDREKAMTKLVMVPSCRTDLKKLASDIAYLYADYKQFTQALEWADCALDFPITSKLSWLYEMGEYNRMRQYYGNHMKIAPNDNEARAYMAQLLSYKGLLFESASVAKPLPAGKAKLELRRAYGKQLAYETLAKKKLFLDTYPDLLSKKDRVKLEQELRWARGNDVLGEYTLFSDRETNILTEYGLSYSWYGSKRNIHQVKTTNSQLFPVNITNDPKNDTANGSMPNLGNEKRSLWGIEYGFEAISNPKKVARYKGRIEKDDRDNLYYQLGASLDINQEKYFGSFQADWYPVKTGPGYTLDLYQLQLQNGNEFSFGKHFRYVFSWEANYYTDAEIDFLGVSRWEYSFWDESDFFAGPLVEAAVGWGTLNRRGGFPYWMDDQRLYAGAGALIRKGNDSDKFQFSLQVAHYWELDEESFESYIGNLRYRIVPFGELTAELELFTLEGYNSNSIILGFRYHL
jgi:hypothetical protein